MSLPPNAPASFYPENQAPEAPETVVPADAEATDEADGQTAAIAPPAPPTPPPQANRQPRPPPGGRIVVRPRGSPLQIDHFRHPGDRVRHQLQAMMEQAHAAFDDFDSFFSAGPDWAELPLSPAMDMRDRGGYYELTLALPNATPESLDVQLNGRQLSIASRQEEQTAHSTSRHSFQSHLLLPGPVDSSVPVLITNEHNRMYIRVAKPGAAMPDTTQGEQP